MPSVHDLKQSKYLTKADVEPPILVTIKSYKKMNVAADGQDPDLKWVFSFQEVDKPLVMNITNGNIIAEWLGEDFDAWIGHKIVLYNDPSISFGGKRTGGIRVRRPKQQTPAPARNPAPRQAPAQSAAEVAFTETGFEDAPPPGDDDFEPVF